MREWWWWWLRHKKWKLEKRREETLSAIRLQRSLLEAMAQRTRSNNDSFNDEYLKERLQRLAQIESCAGQATDTRHLDDLTTFAEQQGQLRAYICPVAEIEHEGTMLIELMEEWGVPKAAIEKLRKSHIETLKKAETNPLDARGALRSLFEEKDSWEDYIDDYEDTMAFHTRWLFAGAIALPVLAVGCFHYAFCWSPLLYLGLLFAGAAGSCVSVLAKMPPLDVALLSAELEAYVRRILRRIAVGVGASLIGCALLGWGVIPISLQNQTFADALNTSLEPLGASASGIKILILLGVPMLLGFSEQALSSFEQRLFGDVKTVAKPG
jgi:hypothetical protein